MSRFGTLYHDTIVPELMKKFGYKTVMQVPRITKITLNMGVGEADTAGRQAVHMGRAHTRRTVAGKVAVAQIVGHEENDVRAVAHAGHRRQGCGKK